MPVRPVGVLVDGKPANTALRARTPLEEWIELTGEPVDDLGGERMPRRLLLATEVEVDVAPRASDVEIHLDYELEALRAFAAKTRLDFAALAFGSESFDTFHGYRILNARPGACDTLDAIAVSRRAGRLGNNLMQILHATNVARALGVAHVYLPEMPSFEIPATGVRVRELRYHGFGSPGEIEGCSLYGTFLFEDLGPAVPALDGVERQRLVDAYAAQLFSGPVVETVRPPQHIAIHLRAGDLFDRPDPHPNFVQPPLAFYELALEDFRAEHADLHVTLVYEDQGNPVIAPLRGRLEAEGIPYSISSASLADDLRVLLEHRALVLGRGSFGLAVAALSQSLDTLYFPWNEPRFHGLAAVRGLAGYVLEEREPRYIEHGDWRNTPEQRRLMVDYPRANLSVRECTNATIRQEIGC
jgi:hypothetical protein